MIPSKSKQEVILIAYNYAREKRRFDAEWKRKEVWYRKEGMSEGSIEEMRRFDLEQFNRDRAYESRRRPLETACGLRSGATMA